MPERHLLLGEPAEQDRGAGPLALAHALAPQRGLADAGLAAQDERAGAVRDGLDERGDAAALALAPDEERRSVRRHGRRLSHRPSLRPRTGRRHRRLAERDAAVVGRQRARGSAPAARPRAGARRWRSSRTRFWKAPPDRTASSRPCGGDRVGRGAREAGVEARGRRPRPGTPAATSAATSRIAWRGSSARHRVGAVIGAASTPPRAPSPPGPRRSTSVRRPHSAATASNSRPTLVVVTRGQRGPPPPSAAASTPAQRRGLLARRRASSQAQAIRHGCRIAASPPGSRTGHRCATRSNAGQVAAQDLPAPHRAVGAVARAVEDRADRRPGLAVLGQARREVRVVVLHADELDVLALERVGGREVVRVQVVRDDLGRDREQPLEVRDALAERAQRLVVAPGRRGAGRPTRVRAPGQAERALELGAAGQHVARGRDRQRSAPGT